MNNYSIKEYKEELKVSDFNIAAGDLANEIGKTFMKRLYKSIDQYSHFNFEKLYFLTSIRKNPTNLKEIHIFINPLRKPLIYLRESYDFWEYNYKLDKLKLLWSLPHRTEMKNFLRTPEKYSKDIIKWIKMYIKQENINLNDKRAQVIK